MRYPPPALSIALLALAWLSTPLRAASSPLVFAPGTLRLGRMPQGVVRRAEATIRNTGPTAVRVLQVSADCGCTTSQVRDPLIQPGQSTTLTVGFESRHYLGPITKRVHLVTSAGTDTLPIEAEVVLYENWDIAPLPLMTPPSLVEQETQFTLALHYRGPAGQGTVRSATTDREWLRAELLPAPRTSEQPIRLTKTVAAPPGTHTAALRIATDDPATPELTLNVIVPVASSLRVSPSPIVLPRVAAGEEARVNFRLIGWRGEHPPRLTCAQGTIDDLGSANGERTYELRIRPARPGSLILPVKIYRDDELQLEVSAVLTTSP